MCHSRPSVSRHFVCLKKYFITELCTKKFLHFVTQLRKISKIIVKLVDLKLSGANLYFWYMNKNFKYQDYVKWKLSMEHEVSYKKRHISGSNFSSYFENIIFSHFWCLILSSTRRIIKSYILKATCYVSYRNRWRSINSIDLWPLEVYLAAMR